MPPSQFLSRLATTFRFCAFSRLLFLYSLRFLSLLVRRKMYLTLFRKLLAINYVRPFFWFSQEDLARKRLLSVSFPIFFSNIQPTPWFWFMWKFFVSNLVSELSLHGLVEHCQIHLNILKFLRKLWFCIKKEAFLQTKVIRIYWFIDPTSGFEGRHLYKKLYIKLRLRLY